MLQTSEGQDTEGSDDGKWEIHKLFIAHWQRDLFQIKNIYHHDTLLLNAVTGIKIQDLVHSEHNLFG